ncbi:MAG: DUF5058 family protein [Faecousia sp.]
MEALKIANSLPMWFACGVAVVLVIVQALTFIKKAIDAAPEVGVTKEQVNTAIKSSALTSIGPSIVVLSGMLSLLVSVGGPMAWMRLSFIGSVMFESIAAGIGTGSVGVQLGVDELTPLALTMAVWTMIIGSVGWIIFSTFAADKMEKIQAKLAGSNPAGLTIISSAAIIGVFAAMCGQRLVALNKASLATVLGGVIMFVMMMITKNEKYAKLREWNLTIAILLAMVITALV